MLSYDEERDNFDRETIPNHAHTEPRCIFCVEFKQRANVAAMAIALRNTDQGWRKKAEQWFRNQPVGSQFTADDLVADIGLPEWISTNGIGAMFATTARAGVIKSVGYANARRMSSHSRVLRIWQRV